MRLVLSARADLDVDLILRETLRLFGARQVDVYSQLISEALQRLVDDPLRPSSVDRSDLAAGLRSFHVGLAGTRRAAASHLAFYIRLDDSDGEPAVVVVRVLHQSMEPAEHVEAGLRALKDEV